MSWLSTLAKIGGIAGAPFSGGASLALTGLGAVGDVLGKQQAGAAKGAADQATIQNSHDRNAIDLYQAQQAAQDRAAQTDLERKAFTTKDRSDVFKQALLGAILQSGGGPSQFSLPGVNSGMVSNPMASVLKDPQFLEAIGKFRTQAGDAQAPPSFTGGSMVSAPTLTPLPEAGKGNGFLNILARIGQIGGAVAPLVKPKANGDYGGEY